MKNYLTTWMAFIFLFLAAFLPVGNIYVVAEGSTEVPIVYVFGRDDCKFCLAEKDFLEANNADWVYLNVTDDDNAKVLFNQITKKHDISKVTPVTVVGSAVLQGYNSDDTTGEQILRLIEKERGTLFLTIEEHIADAPAVDVMLGSGCDEDGIECADGAGSYVFDLPILGLTDLKSFSLFTLSVVLGTIDGFNPCAMWVLITFLVLLSQAGSKRKMIMLAGIFIMAEAIMYNLILNVWYKTWDFVALDQIVTPLVGLLSLGGGAFFVYRWYKNRDVALVCDISNVSSQTKTIAKLQKIVSEPITIATLAAILIIAFSVNIIEFACSIGIPQAYTKILDLNLLTFIERQFYILVYTVGYMLDDFLVFGLAIWGYDKLESHGHKYSQLSLIIGGVLMVLLGALLVFKPELLVL